jgi:WD40 repeat protein
MQPSADSKTEKATSKEVRENETVGQSQFFVQNKLQLIIVNGIFQTCNRTFTSVKQKSIFLTFIILAQFIFNSVFGQNYNAIETFSDHVAGITVMTTDSEKKLLIAGDEKGNIYFYDLISGKQIQKVSVHAAAVTQLRFNSNGKLLISATADGEIKIFDFEKNKVVQAIYSPEYSGIGFVFVFYCRWIYLFQWK